MGGRPANISPLQQGRRNRSRNTKQFMPVYDIDSPRSQRKRQSSTVLRSFRSPVSPKQSGPRFRAAAASRAPFASQPTTPETSQGNPDTRHLQSVPASPPHRHPSLPGATSSVVEDQYVELFNRLDRGDYSHWFESGYEMYGDELHIICNMVNQMAREVGSDPICLPYFQLGGRLEKYLKYPYCGYEH